MSTKKEGLYEFGEYTLDARERVLTRRGREIQLTPKVFEMLCVFVSQPGRLIGKSELMRRIWADSFVEESNLTFNVRQLRKALGDDAQRPKYIGTVPRHGYRFIAEVREIARPAPAATDEKTNGASPETPHESSSEPPPGAMPPLGAANGEAMTAAANEDAAREAPPRSDDRRRPAAGALALAAAVALLGALLLAAFVYRQAQPARASAAPILAADYRAEQLTNAGGVSEAVISPNGKLVAYLSELGGRTGIWLRQLETGEQTPLAAHTADDYYGLAFAPDNESIYFSRGPAGDRTGAVNIYRIAVFGGIPKEIVAGPVEGLFSLAPDGRSISYVRCPRTDEDFCTLYVAGTDGTGERKLLTRPRPDLMRDNQFAPDGRSIAVALGQTRSSSSQFGLVEVELATGAARELSPHKFSSVKRLRWLPDRRALLVTAFEPPHDSVKIFQVPAGGGEVRALTAGWPVNYHSLSLDAEARRMVTVQTTAVFKLWLGPLDAPDKAAPVADGAEAMYTGMSAFCFSPSGRQIVFATSSNINHQLWLMNADGSGKRQLTSSAGTNWQPRFAPDETAIVFASTRTGTARVWRMNADGTSQTPLTEAPAARPIFASPDGRRLYTEAPGEARLHRLTLGGGDAPPVDEPVAAERMFQPEIDRDERRVVYFSREPGRPVEIVVMTLADGQIVKRLPLADERSQPLKVVWADGGRSFYYLGRSGRRHVVWRVALATGAAEVFADLGEDEVSDFALSPDGRSFAFVRGRTLYDAFLTTGLR